MFDNPAFDAHERVVFAEDKESGLRAIVAVHSTAPRPRRRRLPLLALPLERRRADRRAAPVARHELQERDGRPAARRRQGRRDGRRRGTRSRRVCSKPSAAWSTRSRDATSPPKTSARPSRTWKSSRRRRLRERPAAHRGRCRRQSGAEDGARRVPRHQGGRAISARSQQPARRHRRRAGSRRRRLCVVRPARRGRRQPACRRHPCRKRCSARARNSMPSPRSRTKSCSSASTSCRPARSAPCSTATPFRECRRLSSRAPRTTSWRRPKTARACTRPACCMHRTM